MQDALSTIKGLATRTWLDRRKDERWQQRPKRRVVDWIRPVDIRGWAGKAQHGGSAADKARLKGGADNDQHEGRTRSNDSTLSRSSIVGIQKDPGLIHWFQT